MADLEFSSDGIALPELGLWLDPAVECAAAWVSHGHSDHACARHGRVIATSDTLEIYRMRFADVEATPLEYGAAIEFGGARLTALPAAHILGAAQLLIEHRGERILYTGDLKLKAALCGAETATVECDRLVIESTFGLPVFHFLTREEARKRILGFSAECFDQKQVPVFLTHPLGRGQEILNVLCEAGIECTAHGLVDRFVPFYARRGFRFDTLYEGPIRPGTALVTVHGARRPLEASGKNFRMAYVSGWAALANARARSGAEELIPYSDHADFEELVALVERSWPQRVDVVHGYAEAFARILAARGIEAAGHPGVPRRTPPEQQASAAPPRDGAV